MRQGSLRLTGFDSVSLRGVFAASGVFFGTTPGTIVSDSASQVVATAPSEAAGTLDITVTTPGGTSATGSADRFSYTQAAPVVSAVSPGSAPLAGGTSVTIAGAGLAGATAVHFGSAAATITADSATQVVATAPASAPGTVDITVTTPGGSSATAAADRFSFVAATPAVSQVSPGTGPVAGGSSVTITGANLAYASAVRFGSTAGTITSDSATQIVATAPAGSVGSVDVTVVTPGGTSAVSSADRFTYAGVPTISSVSPASGPSAGGSTVVITGANLSAASAVDVGTTPATILSDVANQIVMTTPAGAVGSDDITVTTPGGTSATGSPDQFTYLAPLSTLQVGTSPALASTISIDGIPRDNGAVNITLPAGAHQVCFGSVAGHSPPPCRLVVTVVGTPTSVTGTFDAATSYAYNGDGLRASVTNSGITTQETWNTSAGLPLLLAENSGSAATDFVYGPGGVPLEQIQPNGATFYLYQDAHGSTVAVADANGNVVATATYDPYGNVTATVGSFSTPFGYAGQVTDAQSGLIDLRARYYDPGTGQFLSRDPVAALTQDAYGYTDGDPLNSSDPTGLCSINPFSHKSCLRSVAHAVSTGANWVANHPLQTAGFVVGAVALVTGVGAIGDIAILGVAPEILGTVSTFAAFAGSGLDLPGCIRGSMADCVGVGANLLGGLLGGASQWAALAKIAPLVRVFSVESLLLGLGSSAWDAAHANQALGASQRLGCPSPTPHLA
jgi:RHS repeat-associated protein